MNPKKSYQWAVIGAGPAGIAAVGKLIDLKVPSKEILWIDPAFKVGDLGSLWLNVSSNTKVKYFTDFLYAVESFNYKDWANQFALLNLPAEETCTLKYVVEPLHKVSTHLQQQVNTYYGLVKALLLSERAWQITTDKQQFTAKNVILATGAEPLKLAYAESQTIPFEIAIDKEKLAQLANKSETFAVFGSSHSAIMIVRYLIDLGVKKVINFYRSPCRYAVEMDNWTLFDNTGLKGQTAQWARNNIDGKLPANLERYKSNQHSVSQHLPLCDKVIYAIGFEKRNSILFEHEEQPQHNPHVGIIGPGLFGFGIAYPEDKTDPFGTVESQVGLWKFMVYLNRVMPVWFKYHT